MDWFFYVIVGIIALGFIYVFGNIGYALLTGRNKDKIHGIRQSDGTTTPHHGSAHIHTHSSGDGGGMSGGGGGGGD